MKKIIYLITALFAFHVDAQDATWNFEAALSKSGSINIKNGSGTTINSNINVTGVRTLGRSAPILVKSTNSEVSIGVLFNDYSSLIEDGAGGFVYQDRATTLASNYEVEPVGNVIFISDTLAGHWWPKTRYNSGQGCTVAQNVSAAMEFMQDTTRYRCGSSQQNYYAVDNTRDMSGIVATFGWNGTSYPSSGYTDYTSYFYLAFDAPIYEVYGAAGTLIYSEKISCGGYLRLSAFSTGTVYQAYDFSTCTYNFTNEVETYSGVSCLATFNTGSETTYPRTCNHPSYGTRLVANWTNNGVKLNHTLKYGESSNHRFFYSTNGSRIVSKDGSSSVVMPSSLEDAIAINGLALSVFGGGSHVFVSGNEVFSWDDEAATTTKLFDIPNGLSIIGNLLGTL
jgi:hypothetical protein